MEWEPIPVRQTWLQFRSGPGPMAAALLDGQVGRDAMTSHHHLTSTSISKCTSPHQCLVCQHHIISVNVVSVNVSTYHWCQCCYYHMSVTPPFVTCTLHHSLPPPSSSFPPSLSSSLPPSSSSLPLFLPPSLIFLATSSRVPALHQQVTVCSITELIKK